LRRGSGGSAGSVGGGFTLIFFIRGRGSDGSDLYEEVDGGKADKGFLQVLELPGRKIEGGAGVLQE
jgi:hypothetical protein